MLLLALIIQRCQIKMAATVAMVPREATTLASSLHPNHEQKEELKSPHQCTAKVVEMTGSAECLTKLAPKKRWILLWRQQEQGRKVHAISNQVKVQSPHTDNSIKACSSNASIITPSVDNIFVPRSHKQEELSKEIPKVAACATSEANEQAGFKANDTEKIGVEVFEPARIVRVEKAEVTEDLSVVSLTISERMRLERKKNRKSNWDVGAPENGNADPGSTFYPAYMKHSPHADTNHERYSRSHCRSFTSTYRRRTDLAFRPRSFHEKHCRDEFRFSRSRSRSRNRNEHTYRGHDNFSNQCRLNLSHQSL